MPQNARVATIANAKPLRLGICSLGHLENLLGVSQVELLAVSKMAGAKYGTFSAPEKVRPFQKKFKPPKNRPISNPNTDLKRIQKLIYKRLLRNLNLPYYLCGGVKGRTILDNVLCHSGAPMLVTVDIKNFFPSISNLHVYRVWNEILGCSPEISALLTRLTTFERRLPQGAPTSTLLANLVLNSVDEPIRSECESRSITYTSWVDDLAFSGPNSSNILEVVIPTLHRSGFRISRKKIKIMGPGDRKTLTGILLGRFPSVVGERLSQIRSGIHKIKVNEVKPQEMGPYIGSLRSRIAQVATIHPRRANKLKLELDELLRMMGPNLTSGSK